MKKLLRGFIFLLGVLVFGCSSMMFVAFCLVCVWVGLTLLLTELFPLYEKYIFWVCLGIGVVVGLKALEKLDRWINTLVDERFKKLFNEK